MRIFKHVEGILILAVFTALAIGSGTMEGATTTALYGTTGTAAGYFQNGQEAAEKGDYDQAIADYTQAINLSPNYAMAYNNRGWAYYLKGDLDQAIKDTTKAIQLDPDVAYAYITRGHVYDNMGDIDRAVADFEIALSLDPNNTDVKRYLAQAQQGGEMPTQQQGNQTPNQQLAQAQQLPPEMAQGNSLADKLAWVQAFAQNNGYYILEVSADESIPPQVLEFSGKTNITIALRGIGRNRTISLSSNSEMFYLPGVMFYISSGVNMILENYITLKGRSRNNDYLVDVNGTLNMSDGAIITGNTGGGVNVNGKGSFIMSGGIISGNSNNSGGGGVCVWGNFTMNGGTISGNTSSYGGGGVEINATFGDGTFTMSDGIISGNTSSYGGGGVRISSNGTFNMSGGNISGNTSSYGGGVYHWSGTFNMSGGNILNNTARTNGGGVFMVSTFSKTGGTITGYASDSDKGNAVKNDSGAIQNFRGHAVFLETVDQTLKIKESTAGPSDNLSYRNGTASGAWDN